MFYESFLLDLNWEKRQNEALATFQNDLRPYVERGNFTRKENFHLTLWFIGETDSAQVSMITHALEDIARHFAPFEIELGDLNAFQKKNRKILWIGPSSGLYHLEKLYDALEKDLGILVFIKNQRRLHLI